MFIIYSISLSSHTKFLFYVYFMLTVAPGGNNLATICYKDFLGLATINMYYYYYYYGNAEKFYTAFYGLLVENVFPLKLDITSTNILMSEVANHILIYLSDINTQRSYHGSLKCIFLTPLTFTFSSAI